MLFGYEIFGGISRHYYKRLVIVIVRKIIKQRYVQIIACEKIIFYQLTFINVNFMSMFDKFISIVQKLTKYFFVFNEFYVICAFGVDLKE